MNNTYLWIKNILDNEYGFIRNIKRTEEEVINVLQNKYNNQRVIVKYYKGSAAAYSMQRSRILNRMVQGFLLGADRVHSRIRAESRCKLAWLLLILTFSAGFSIDCGWCKPDDSTAQIADWFA